MSGIFDLMRDVAGFHFKFNIPVRSAPRPIDPAEAHRRFLLINEEADELLDALQDQNLEEIADGIADLIYVAIGTALTFGIDLAPVWYEVQRTNMLKEGGAFLEKIKKPAGWQPPRIKEALQRQHFTGSLWARLGGLEWHKKNASNSPNR